MFFSSLRTKAIYVLLSISNVDIHFNVWMPMATGTPVACVLSEQSFTQPAYFLTLSCIS